MRRAAALALAILLAGCSALAPPPKAEQSEESEGLPIPRLTPRVPGRAEPECAHVQLDVLGGRPGEIGRAMGATLEVSIVAMCDAPLELAFGPRCPGELVLVEIVPFENLSERYVLGSDGAAYPARGPCPERAADTAPVLPAHFTLSRSYGWNATIASPCPGLRDCWTYEPVHEGHHEIVATVWGAGTAFWTASSVIRIWDFCTDIQLRDETPGEHRVELTIENGTRHGTSWNITRGEPAGTIRWCGPPGDRWVRYVDSATGVDESAKLNLTGAWIVVRHSPLRVEPPPTFEWV